MIVYGVVFHAKGTIVYTPAEQAERARLLAGIEQMWNRLDELDPAEVGPLPGARPWYEAQSTEYLRGELRQLSFRVMAYS